MSNSGFTNTFILECNRLSSEEVKSGNNSNPAHFTNKVNDGLRLNTGDVVGVHSAYISELGAEGSDIEIKGRVLDTLNGSQILSYNTISNEGFEGSSANNSSLTKKSYLYNGFPLSRRVDVNERILYRDDEVNMVMSPYKNTNGEYYITLPYRYGVEETTNIVQQILLWNTPQPIIGLDQSLTGSASKTFGNASIGNLTRFPKDESWNNSDMRYYVPKPTTTSIGGSGGATKNGSFNVAVRHDNSRFSIYQLKNTIHTSGGYDGGIVSECLKGIEWDPNDTNTHMSNASYIKGLTYDGKYGNEYWNDIACREYVRVRNKVNCSVTSGYNSNSDIANKLTEDMVRTQDIESVRYNRIDYSIFAENQVCKLYNTATPYSFSEENWKTFNTVPGFTNDTEFYYNYIEAHQTIGVKRPELYELGRALSTTSGGYDLRFDYFTNLNSQYNASGLIYTSIPWSKVQDLKNLVDAQHKYPELFDTRYINNLNALSSTTPLETPGSAGFLHINTNSEHLFLGYDLTDNNANYWTNTITEIAPDVCPNASFCSIPFFFDINSSTTNMPEGKIATGKTWENAVYGFAVKSYNAFSDEYYIALKSSAHYNLANYSASGEPIIPLGTKIGWDYHFNAYGCPCILLWNGFSGEDGVGYQGYGLSYYVNPDDSEGILSLNKAVQSTPFIYLGSPDVEVGYDQDSDRFEILKLHTSERIGNLYNAGYQAEIVYEETDASGVVVFTNPDGEVPTNDNSDSRVYKINKQLTKTNYTPCMAPYNNEVNASFYTRYTDTNNASYIAQQIVEYPNNNFVNQSIFDSTCGNFIVDWGMNEKYWNESLWGVMGFRYNQTSGRGNTQTRVINSVSWGDTLDGMDENTTNADITNLDFFTDGTRNFFNQKTYGLTPHIPQTPRFESMSGNACHTFSPPISVTQTRGQPLRALEIPTRTLRPYYTIRSNIIGQGNYFGSSQSSIPLPVVAVVEKVSQSGDFFNLSQGRLQFTITQPTMLTDITTSIHDPDGSFSKVSSNSAVLYQVQRQVNADMNVVSTILQGDNKKQAQEFEEQLEPPQPTKKDINDVIKGMMN